MDFNFLISLLASSSVQYTAFLVGSQQLLDLIVRSFTDFKVQST